MVPLGPTLLFPRDAAPPEVPTACPLGPRDCPRDRAGRDVRGPRDRRGVQGRGGAAPAGSVAEQPAIRGREPAPVRMLPRAARPERPERLPALRPAAPGRRALSARARLLPLLLVAALAGCGGDDEPAETTRELPDLSVPTIE